MAANLSEFNSENLIFLISQPRSGSTMLQRILSGHPEVHTTAEPWFMLNPIYALRKKGHESEYDAQLATEALEDFCATLPLGQEHYYEAVRRMSYYLYGTATYEAGKSYFLDKTPRYYLIIPELARIFPLAKFIILLRNPLAVLNSLLKTMVKEYWISLARYRGDLLLAPQLLVDGITELGERVHVIHYESLVVNPKTQIGNLCQSLELSFHPDMLDYGQHRPPEGRMGDPSGVKRHKKPTAKHLGQWKEIGKRSQTLHFAQRYLNDLGSELINQMGYDYEDLDQQLHSQATGESKVEIKWDVIFAPDPEIKRRLFYVELAILEHRRLIHRIRSAFGKV